jgi:demethoxyubiquinone hydroxylase (CLK1/Coq7/Cat5 family)
MQTNESSQTTTRTANIAKLEECLRGELSAVETYELALKSIDHVGLHHTLQQILASHSLRAELIIQKFKQLGAEPPKGSGLWGAFAKAVQSGADLLGDLAALTALEEGEDEGIRLYSQGLDECNSKTRRFIELNLLPEQQRTHELCRTMKEYVVAPS